MTDRELLERAAKAAQLEGESLWAGENGISLWTPRTGTTFWNPLTDDGDALRLVSSLRMTIEYQNDKVWCQAGYHDYQWAEESTKEDRAAATRRAIVRAAAEVGKAMQ